jgi:hypothetical protein
VLLLVLLLLLLPPLLVSLLLLLVLAVWSAMLVRGCKPLHARHPHQGDANARGTDGLLYGLPNLRADAGVAAALVGSVLLLLLLMLLVGAAESKVLQAVAEAASSRHCIWRLGVQRRRRRGSRSGGRGALAKVCSVARLAKEAQSGGRGGAQRSWRPCMGERQQGAPARAAGQRHCMLRPSRTNTNRLQPMLQHHACV